MDCVPVLDCMHGEDNPWGNDCYICPLEEIIQTQGLMILRIEERLKKLEDSQNAISQRKSSKE